MNPSTRISDLTVEELTTLIAETVRKEMNPCQTVSGIGGLARIFGVSESTAKRIKASGIIDKAISQSGRTIITDAPLAMELYSQATHGRRKY